MTDIIYDDNFIADILKRVKTIAMVGASAKPARPSYMVMSYLQNLGYKVIPVNPGLAGQEILGETVAGTLSDIETPVDMVDVFRNSDAALVATREAIEIGASVVWLQQGVVSEAARDAAHVSGLDFVMDRCPKREHGRLSGRIQWLGVNTGRLSSKRRRLLE